MKILKYIKNNKIYSISLFIITILWIILIAFTEFTLYNTRSNLIDLEATREQEHYEKVLNDIFNNLNAIKVFVETEGVDQITQDSFDRFAEKFDFSNIGFVSFSIAPNGVIAYYYSEEYEDDLIGLDLVNDERDYVREAVDYAIINKVIVINGPFLLLQGGNGLVFREAIFEDDEFVAIINLVINYNQLNEIFEEDKSKVVDIGIYKTDNTLIFGDLEYNDNIMNLEKIQIPNVDWRIGTEVSKTYNHKALITDVLTITFSSFLYGLAVLISLKLYNKIKSLLATQEVMINYDILTGLPNRIHLRKDVEEAINNNQPFYLGFGDLDNFKLLNDVVGHSVGDIYLKEVAKQFKKICNEYITIYRWGGDEFIVIIKTDSKDTAIKAINAIYKKFQTPIRINNVNYDVSISIGVVSYPRHGITMDDLVKRADIVMYDVKSQNKNSFSFFENRYLDRLQNEIDFENKVNQYNIEDFQVYLQPIIDVKTNEVIGFEALSRLFDKEGKSFNIIDVIKVYEHQGKIPKLDQHVFDTLCDYSVKLKKEFNQEFLFSFNVSPLTLSKDFVKYLEKKIKSLGINPGQFIFEVIETIGFKEINESVKLLGQLKDIGFQIAMDDFGMGYSSLSYITKLPLSIIKIDRYFIQNYDENKLDKLLIIAIRDICKSLNLKIVVEGIETTKQLDFIKSIEAHYYQGFIHSKAMSYINLIEKLKKGF